MENTDDFQKSNRVGAGWGDVSPFDLASLWVVRQRPAISGRNGHGQCYRVACTLAHGFLLDEEQVLKVLWIYNKRCKPPWSQQELRHKAHDAVRSEPRGRRGYLLGASHRSLKTYLAARPGIVLRVDKVGGTMPTTDLENEVTSCGRPAHDTAHRQEN